MKRPLSGFAASPSLYALCARGGERSPRGVAALAWLTVLGARKVMDARLCAQHLDN